MWQCSVEWVRPHKSQQQKQNQQRGSTLLQQPVTHLPLCTKVLPVPLRGFHFEDKTSKLCAVLCLAALLSPCFRP